MPIIPITSDARLNSFIGLICVIIPFIVIWFIKNRNDYAYLTFVWWGLLIVIFRGVDNGRSGITLGEWSIGQGLVFILFGYFLRLYGIKIGAFKRHHESTSFSIPAPDQQPAQQVAEPDRKHVAQGGE